MQESGTCYGVGTTPFAEGCQFRLPKFAVPVMVIILNTTFGRWQNIYWFPFHSYILQNAHPRERLSKVKFGSLRGAIGSCGVQVEVVGLDVNL